MRLLIITFDPPESVGGVEGRAIGYVRQLRRTKNAVELASFAPNAKPLVEPFPGGGRIHRFPSDITSVPRSLREIIRMMRSKRIDTVFFLSGGATLLGTLLLSHCKLAQVRSAVFTYGKDTLIARHHFVSRAFLGAAQILADKVVVNSRFTSTLLLGRAPKTAILYPSVEPSVFRTPENGLKPKYTVLFVGRLVERKGVGDLLNALSLLKGDVPGVRLEIVGDGPERTNLEMKAAELGVVERVEFFGELRGEQLYTRYARCTVFAMPSKTLRDDVEGFGTVFLEAGLFGKPSVGTRSGGIPEAVLDGKTGILANESDVRGIAGALKKLLTNPGLAKTLGDNARERVLQKFTWEEGTRQLVRIIEEKT